MPNQLAKSKSSYTRVPSQLKNKMRSKSAFVLASLLLVGMLPHLLLGLTAAACPTAQPFPYNNGTACCSVQPVWIPGQPRDYTTCPSGDESACPDAPCSPLADCTGNSTKLAPKQCAAYMAMYDSTGGPEWTGKGKGCVRSDPCSCNDYIPGPGPRYPGIKCNAAGTGITEM